MLLQLGLRAGSHRKSLPRLLWETPEQSSPPILHASLMPSESQFGVSLVPRLSAPQHAALVLIIKSRCLCLILNWIQQISLLCQVICCPQRT